MLFMFLSVLLLSGIDALPLSKMQDTSSGDGDDGAGGQSNLVDPSGDSNLMAKIMSSKDDHKVLLSILANADPAKLNEVISLVKSLIDASTSELQGLIAAAEVANAAYNGAVNIHDTAVSTQTSGVAQLETELLVAKATAVTVTWGTVTVKAALRATTTSGQQDR
jgi:hypothetical protein